VTSSTVRVVVRTVEVVPFEQFTEPVTVNEVDRWRTVAGRFPFSVRGERARRDQQALVASSCHRPAKVPDSARADAATVALALEEDREAEEAEPVDAEPIDPAIPRSCR
jgi:hypothetical protein